VSDRLYFRQLLSGRDFASGDALAHQMANFVYAVGDRRSGEAVLVDPAHHPIELRDLLEADGMTLTGVIATHYHFDHVGGDFMGHRVTGIAELLAANDVPVHVQAAEAEWITRCTGVDASSLVTHQSGDRVAVGDLEVTLIHTPGHSPGSQCLLAEGHLVSGDTLFLDGCGRTDLPGADAEEMYWSLTQGLAGVSDTVVLYPGHFYSDEPSAALGEVRRTNYVLAPMTLQQWLARFAP
jgi:hydroxyacylglutathione hydrolase